MLHPIQPRSRWREIVSSCASVLIHLIHPIHISFEEEFRPPSAPRVWGRQLRDLYSVSSRRDWIRWIRWIGSNRPMCYAIQLLRLIQRADWIAPLAGAGIGPKSARGFLGGALRSGVLNLCGYVRLSDGP